MGNSCSVMKRRSCNDIYNGHIKAEGISITMHKGICIRMHEGISLSNNRVYSLFAFYGIKIDPFPRIDRNPLVQFLGAYQTDIILFHCFTPSGDTIVLPHKEFLGPIIGEIPLDYLDSSIFGKNYDISCKKYTGRLFLQGMMEIGLTSEEKPSYLIWKKRNGEYFYLSSYHYMQLDRDDKKFLQSLYPMSADKYIDDKYKKLRLN